MIFIIQVFIIPWAAWAWVVSTCLQTSTGYAGSAVRCGTMDSFDVGALPAEPVVIFCVATAGKGEFCGNGRSSV
jgi:hypothetical protein